MSVEKTVGVMRTLSRDKKFGRIGVTFEKKNTICVDKLFIRTMY